METHGFRRILLATDGTPQADAAGHFVAALAQSAGATVRVVHCWSLEVHLRHDGWEVEMRSEAEKLIADAVDRLHALGLQADGQVIRAEAAHIGAAIAESVRMFEADLLVVGSRGLSDWRALFEHGVSNQVLTSVKCPVLVVREDAASLLHEPTRVLLAVAGGDDVAPAARAAIAAAWAPGSTVLVTHVAQALISVEGAYVESDEEIQSTIDRAARLLKEAGIATETTVAGHGPVARVVAKVAAQWQADLIVIGSSRIGNLASIVLGSVTHDLIRETSRPVLVAERSSS